MATKPEPSPLSSFDVFKLASKAVWLARARLRHGREGGARRRQLNHDNARCYHANDHTTRALSRNLAVVDICRDVASSGLCAASETRLHTQLVAQRLEHDQF